MLPRSRLCRAALLKAEEEWVAGVCGQIAALKPDLVITEKGLSDLAAHFLTKVRGPLGGMLTTVHSAVQQHFTGVGRGAAPSKDVLTRSSASPYARALLRYCQV